MKNSEIIEKTLEFNPSKAKEKIVDFIRKKVEEANADGLVLGLSGGLDSSTATYLSVEALGKDRFKAIFMPEEGVTREKSVEDAYKVAEDLEIELKEIEISPMIKTFEENFDLGKEEKKATANLKARTRMIITYHYANLYNYLVVGGSNKTEINCGYFTKFGDGASDLKPIGPLYKTQVRELARELGVPENIIQKSPTADLWKGQKDKDELGLSYDKIDRIYAGLENDLSPEDIAETVGVKKSEVQDFIKRKRNSQHKIEPAPIPEI